MRASLRRRRATRTLRSQVAALSLTNGAVGLQLGRMRARYIALKADHRRWQEALDEWEALQHSMREQSYAELLQAAWHEAWVWAWRMANEMIDAETGVPPEPGGQWTSFICPIGYTLLCDPVVAADGHSYERQNVERWFATGQVTSPMTGEALPTLRLTSNHALRNAIDEWLHFANERGSPWAASELAERHGGDGHDSPSCGAATAEHSPQLHEQAALALLIDGEGDGQLRQEEEAPGPADRVAHLAPRAVGPPRRQQWVQPPPLQREEPQQLIQPPHEHDPREHEPRPLWGVPPPLLPPAGALVPRPAPARAQWPQRDAVLRLLDGLPRRVDPARGELHEALPRLATSSLLALLIILVVACLAIGLVRVRATLEQFLSHVRGVDYLHIATVGLVSGLVVALHMWLACLVHGWLRREGA